MKKFAIALLCVMFASSIVLAASGNSAAAKSSTTGANEGQMAIGYNTGMLTGGGEAISFKYCFTNLFALEGLLGFGTGDNMFGQGAGGSLFGFGAKAFYIFKRYSSFNFYGTFGMSIGVVSPKQGDSQTLFGILGGVGIEYFLARNLSISSELGLGGNFLKDNNQFGTFGNWANNFGLRYYFGS